MVIVDLLVLMREEFFKWFKVKIDEKKCFNWLEIYFMFFVMMFNIGWIIKDMIVMIMWKGFKMGNCGG